VRIRIRKELVTHGVLLTARMIMAGCFTAVAITRVPNLSGFSHELWLKGVPYPNAAAALVAVADLFGPAALIIGFAPRISASVLISATVFTTATLHSFWNFAGPALQSEQAMFLANFGLVAGLLLYAVSGPGAWSWHAFWQKTHNKETKTNSPLRTTTAKPRSKRSHFQNAA
jgi:putative oxidoreductase